jgi:hypothetical protein
MIAIINRWTGAQIYASETAQTIAEAVSQAIVGNANLSRADLSGANLSRANLSRANLSGANLSGANCNTAIGGDFLVLRGSRHSLIATTDAISIGCIRNTLDWWREHYAGVGRAEGYSAAEVDEYRQHIEYAAVWLEGKSYAKEGN